MIASSRHTATMLVADPESVSVKRVAWAFGCAKKDSDEEHALYKMLLAKVEKILADRKVSP